MNCVICGNWFSSAVHDEACPVCSGAIKRLGLDMTPARLLELARAEKDGRLVAPPPNDPLTLEELREMDGEPVWVVSGSFGDYRIPDFIDEGAYRGFIHFTDRSAEPIADYGRNWLAYRRKLEEGTT